MAKRKVVVTTIVPVCDNCGERISTRGSKANNVEHQAVQTIGSNAGSWYVLDFCGMKCKTEWIESHEAAEAPTQRPWINEADQKRALKEQTSGARVRFENGHLVPIEEAIP